MNTNPDESLLALWLDDELHGEELVAVEAWALTQPEQLAAREEVRKWRAMMSAAVPAVEEPPFPDFFNSRIEKAIREQPVVKPAPAPAKTSFWRSWFVPATAFAGMAVAFWVGTQTKSTESQVAQTVSQIQTAPVVYTPEQGVDAKWFASSNASATVIVLEGVNAIPSTLDFSETASVPTSGNENSDQAIGLQQGERR
jgi:hypothetical protein